MERKLPAGFAWTLYCPGHCLNLWGAAFRQEQHE
jgi:hypothetical protein